MANNAVKTIFRAFPTLGTTDIVDSTLTTLGTITLDFPENSSGTPITFKSVMAHMYFQDKITVTGGTITETRLALTLSGVGASTVTETDDLINSGENIAGVFSSVDFTSYFNTNFGTAATKSIQADVYFAQSTGTTLGMRAVSIILEITYEYDATVATHLRTGIIGISAETGALSTTTNYAFGAIPIIDNFLVETSPTIVDYFIVLEGNIGGTTGTADVTLNYAIDSGGAVTLPAVARALASGVYVRYIINLTGSNPSTSATHVLNLWSNTASYFQCLTAKLYVTYKFTLAGTTRIWNSLRIPVNVPSPVYGTSTSDRSRSRVTIPIEEPGTLTLKDSHLELFIVSDVSPVPAVKVGAQSGFTSYTLSGSVVCGSMQVLHRIDGGTPGNAFSFAKGDNVIDVDMYRTNTNFFYMVTGLIYLNYLSDVPTLGISKGNHSVSYFLKQIDYTAAGEDVVTFQPTIPESTYKLSSIAVLNQYWISTTSTTMRAMAEIASGESIDDGWEILDTEIHRSDQELGFFIWLADATGKFKRQANEAKALLDPFASRRWRIVKYDTGAPLSIQLLVNYHSQKTTVGGTISNSSGGTVTVKLFKQSNDDLIATTSRSGDGTYSIDVYDTVNNYYTVAYESSSLKGRSKNGLGTATDLDISLTTGGGSGEGAYVG